MTPSSSSSSRPHQDPNLIFTPKQRTFSNTNIFDTVQQQQQQQQQQLRNAATNRITSSSSSDPRRRALNSHLIHPRVYKHSPQHSKHTIRFPGNLKTINMDASQSSHQLQPVSKHKALEMMGGSDLIEKVFASGYSEDVNKREVLELRLGLFDGVGGDHNGTDHSSHTEAASHRHQGANGDTSTSMASPTRRTSADMEVAARIAASRHHVSAASGRNSETIREDEVPELPPKNPNAPISMRSSKARNVTRLLLKVQPRYSPQQQMEASAARDDEKYHVELFPIRQHIGFENSLCDFQFCLAPRLEAQKVMEHDGAASEESTPLSLTPYQFLHQTRSDSITYDYAFHPHTDSHNRYYYKAQIVKWNDPKPQFYCGENKAGLPRQPVPVPSNPAEKLLRDTIKKMFQKRPIWSRKALKSALGNHPFISAWRMERALLYYSYIIKDGPHIGLLVRFGVDPRADPQYAKYQLFHFKVPAPLREFIPEGNMDHSPYFTGTVTQWRIDYQLCDIRLKSVVKIVKKEVTKRYDRESGFYTQHTMDSIRDKMKKKMHQVMDSPNWDPEQASTYRDDDSYDHDVFHPNIKEGEFNLTDKLEEIQKSGGWTEGKEEIEAAQRHLEAEAENEENEELDEEDEEDLILGEDEGEASDEDAMVIDDSALPETKPRDRDRFVADDLQAGSDADSSEGSLFDRDDEEMMEDSDN